MPDPVPAPPAAPFGLLYTGGNPAILPGSYISASTVALDDQNTFVNTDRTQAMRFAEAWAAEEWRLNSLAVGFREVVRVARVETGEVIPAGDPALMKPAPPKSFGILKTIGPWAGCFMAGSEFPNPLNPCILGTEDSRLRFEHPWEAQGWLEEHADPMVRTVYAVAVVETKEVVKPCDPRLKRPAALDTLAIRPAGLPVEPIPPPMPTMTVDGRTVELSKTWPNIDDQPFVFAPAGPHGVAYVGPADLISVAALATELSAIRASLAKLARQVRKRPDHVIVKIGEAVVDVDAAIKTVEGIRAELPVCRPDVAGPEHVRCPCHPSQSKSFLYRGTEGCTGVDPEIVLASLGDADVGPEGGIVVADLPSDDALALGGQATPAETEIIGALTEFRDSIREDEGISPRVAEMVAGMSAFCDAIEAGDPIEVTEIVLSRNDFGAVMEVIENPPAPSESMLRAAARYGDVVNPDGSVTTPPAHLGGESEYPYRLTDKIVAGMSAHCDAIDADSTVGGQATPAESEVIKGLTEFRDGLRDNAPVSYSAPATSFPGDGPWVMSESAKSGQTLGLTAGGQLRVRIPTAKAGGFPAKP